MSCPTRRSPTTPGDSDCRTRCAARWTGCRSGCGRPCVLRYYEDMTEAEIAERARA